MVNVRTDDSRPFRIRLSDASDRSRIILACDHLPSQKNGISAISAGIKSLSPFLCAIKLNFHLLLPFSRAQISKITDVAHRCGLQTIADIKLNDIGNTNKVATDNLWDMGFDAVIANPIMGLKSLSMLAESAHTRGNGLITLCHMSAPGADLAYGMDVSVSTKKTEKLYELFLDWALDSRADGIIVGATFPDVVDHCARRIKKSRKRTKPWIISPGVGVQGGSAAMAVSAGSDYLIVGRSILSAKNPTDEARRLCTNAGRC